MGVCKMEKCPKCGNEQIKEIGEIHIGYERSVLTGKLLQKDKWGSAVWWKYTCRCGWESEQFSD